MSIPTGVPCVCCGSNSSSDIITLDSSLNVLEILRSGHMPPSSALSSIPDRVAALKTRQSLLCEDIGRLEFFLLQNRNKLATTEIEIRQTESLAAPIRSIPPEILLRIFSLVHEVTMPPRKFIALFKIGHVCHLWRTLSRASPSLWSTIDLVEHGGESVANGIEKQLVLSSPCPLNIHISWHDPFHPRPTKRLLRVLSGHISRCRSIDMTVTCSSFLSILDRAHLGILERLTVTYLHYGRREQLGSKFKTLNLVFHPSLHSLDTALPLDYFEAVKIHWPSLTSFAGPFPNPESFLQFFTSAEQLVNLNITCIGTNGGLNDELGQLLVHDNLHRLTLDTFCSISPALEKVSLPRLDDLILQQKYGSHVTCKNYILPDHSVLSRLVERSQCKVKTFTLDEQHDIPPEKLTPILQLSSITSFRVFLGPGVEPGEISTFLNLLTVTDSQISLPSLGELELRFYTTTDASLLLNEQLPTMIQSRWDVRKDVARLSKLTLYMTALFKPHPVCSTSTLASLLLNLQDKGLDVSWMMKTQDVLKEAREHR